MRRALHIFVIPCHAVTLLGDHSESIRSRWNASAFTDPCDHAHGECDARKRDRCGFLGAGEPDFNTPEPICQAAIDAIKGSFTKYTPSNGILQLRNAIVAKLERDNGLKYSAAQIVVGVGAKQALYNTMQVLLDSGDEVILIAPYWMTYADQIRLAGGVPVTVRTSPDDGFVVDPDVVKQAVSPAQRRSS